MGIIFYNSYFYYYLFSYCTAIRDVYLNLLFLLLSQVKAAQALSWGTQRISWSARPVCLSGHQASVAQCAAVGEEIQLHRYFPPLKRQKESKRCKSIELLGIWRLMLQSLSNAALEHAQTRDSLGALTLGTLDETQHTSGTWSDETDTDSDENSKVLSCCKRFLLCIGTLEAADFGALLCRLSPSHLGSSQPRECGT